MEKEYHNYVVLLFNKRDTNNRHWKTFNSLLDAKNYADSWEANNWMALIHEVIGNY